MGSVEVSDSVVAEEWNKEQQHPFQTTIYPEIDAKGKYKFFRSSNGKKYVFFITKLGPLKIANLKFPDVDEQSIKEFVSYCKKNFSAYCISMYEQLDFLGDYDQDFTYVIDVSNIQLEKGARCNVSKAIKEGVAVRKLDDYSFWQKQNEIHNSLLKRKGINFDEQERKSIYDKLYSCNSNHSLLYGAFYKNQMIAGLVISYAGSYGLFTKAAVLEDYYSLAPLPLLIKTACENEKQRFKFLDMNLGIGAKYSQQGEIGNIIRFKKQYGYQIPVYTYMPGWFLKIKKLKYAIKGLAGRRQES